MEILKTLPQIGAVMALFSTIAVADPADLNPIAFSQNDGTIVTIQEFGDEHYHYAETIDGYLIVGDGNGGYVYADANGMPSKWVAQNADCRSEKEKAFLSSLNQDDVHARHQALNENQLPETLASEMELSTGRKRVLSNSLADRSVQPYVTGEQFFPVLLVSTADYASIDSGFISRMFNEKNFKEENHYGSMRDYFDVSSAEQFAPVFDIYSIHLPLKFEDYANDIAQFMAAALDILVTREDFKARADKYESVIPFIFLHPTTKAKAKAFNSNYGNHHYFMKYRTSNRSAYSKGGYRFDNYAFISQKYPSNENKVGMLGTFIHEFSHILGLKDTYANNEQGYSVYGPLAYDVMSLGLENGSGRYPPTYAAFEREMLGWLTPTEINLNDSIFELKDISKMQAYAVTNPNASDEYFLIEFRPAVGFDSKIGVSSYDGKKGKNGVLIWYVDYDVTEFYYNRVNKNLEHYRFIVKSAITKNQEYFVDFSFVNKNGVAKIPGVYNFVFDGDERVCFTVDKNVELEACPAKEISSSSAAVSSSSAEVSSSSSALESSSSQMESSSSADVSSSSVVVALSSSGYLTPIAEVGVSPMLRLGNQNGGLFVEVSLPGKKRLKFFDALGHFVSDVSFDGQDAFVDFTKLGTFGSLIVRLEVNGRFVAARRIANR